MARGNVSETNARSNAPLTLVKQSDVLKLANRKVRANPDAMRRAAKILGVEPPKTRGDKANQELLQSMRLEVSRRLASIDPELHTQCPACFEVATDDTDFCPYCGDLGDETPQAAEARAKALQAAQAEQEDDAEEEAVEAADDSDDESAEDDVGNDDEEEPGDDDDAESSDDESDEDVEEEEAEEEEVEEPVVEDTSVGIAPKKRGRGTAIVQNVDAALAVQQEELDAAIARIIQLKRNYVGLTYDLGVELRLIRDKQLFKARGYASFKAFSEKELPFARESAQQLISIVEKHSREDYNTIGYTKLRALSAVTEGPAKEEILEAARKGATAKEVKEKVKAAVTSGAGTPKAKARAAAAPEKGPRITLLGTIGAKAKIVRFNDLETGEQLPSIGVFSAKGLRESVYAEMEISDGVYVRIGLRLTAKKELEGLTLRFVRADTE